MVEDFRPSVLVLHVYVVNNWKAVSRHLLSNVPHDHIYVSISADKLNLIGRWQARRFFSRYPKVQAIWMSENRKALSEVHSLNLFREKVPLDNYRLLTYLHAKGVTKPKNKNIRDWVELMRHFIMDRYDDGVKAFRAGYSLYGINMGIYKAPDERYGPYAFSEYHYSGNFVTVNLDTLRDAIRATPVDEDYFGVEGYWGKLCPREKAWNAHMSSDNITNHYKERYPKHFYQ